MDVVIAGYNDSLTISSLWNQLFPAVVISLLDHDVVDVREDVEEAAQWSQSVLRQKNGGETGQLGPDQEFIKVCTSKREIENAWQRTDLCQKSLASVRS